MPEPTVYFDGFGDNALNFELAVWTETMTFSPRRFRSNLYYAIEKALRLNRIEIPYPQRVVHVRRQPDEAPAARDDARGKAPRPPHEAGEF